MCRYLSSSSLLTELSPVTAAVDDVDSTPFVKDTVICNNISAAATIVRAPHLEVAHDVGVLQAGQGGHLPDQAGEALRGLGLHLDLFDGILAAVQAVDGGHHHPIPPLPQAAQLLEIALVP